MNFFWKVSVEKHDIDIRQAVSEYQTYEILTNLNIY